MQIIYTCCNITHSSVGTTLTSVTEQSSLSVSCSLSAAKYNNAAMDTTLLLILAATILLQTSEGSSVSHVKTCYLPKEDAICMMKRRKRDISRTYLARSPGMAPLKWRLSYFYYNCETGVCERFGLYEEGCGGNDNHFRSLEACQKHCAGVVCHVCSLPNKVSNSTRLYSRKRYSYNSKTGACEQFFFDFHGGNRNNFKTRQACEDKCVTGASGPLRVTLVESGCITDWLGLGKTYCFRDDPVMLRCEFSGGSGAVHVELVKKEFWGEERIVPGTGLLQFTFDPLHHSWGEYFCRVTDQSLNVTAESSVVDFDSICMKGCPKIYDPVCGSDGKIYSNSCYFEIEKCENPGLHIRPCPLRPRRKRTCRLRLGGHCMTEALDKAASQYWYLKSPHSPGR